MAAVVVVLLEAVKAAVPALVVETAVVVLLVVCGGQPCDLDRVRSFGFYIPLLSNLPGARTMGHQQCKSASQTAANLGEDGIPGNGKSS